MRVRSWLFGKGELLEIEGVGVDRNYARLPPPSELAYRFALIFLSHDVLVPLLSLPCRSFPLSSSTAADALAHVLLLGRSDLALPPGVRASPADSTPRSFSLSRRLRPGGCVPGGPVERRPREWAWGRVVSPPTLWHLSAHALGWAVLAHALLVARRQCCTPISSITEW